MNNVAKIMLTVCVAGALASNAATPDIAGIWSATSRTKGGLGSQWTFAEDGRATYMFGAIVDFLYNAKDSGIVMNFVQPNGKAASDTATNEFALAGDTLTINPTDAERRQVMRRVGSAREKTSIVGEWTYEHYTGGPAFMRYSSGGQGQLVVPMKTIEGRYRIENGRLIIITLLGEGISLTATMREDQTLSVRDEQGRDTHMKLFRY